MNITGKITGIKYRTLLADNPTVISMKDFDINKAPSVCLLNNKNCTFAVSKWVSPKRTRSYPFERVYNTLHLAKKITVIPIIKDEGEDGDRDYIQWDTVSLMSLLDVFVVFAYYDEAEINPRNSKKITNQQLNNKYVISKVKEIEQYHSSALHWNLNELQTNFQKIIQKAKKSYAEIECKAGVKLHDFAGLEKFQEKIGKDVSLFMEFSRDKAEQAQAREYVTVQPKESLSTLSKAKITITNYLGGQYFFTVDEISMLADTLYLIEGKHSKNALLPSISDIKDGLLKMILYSNLTQVTANENSVKHEAVLSLTSCKIKGCVSSASTKKELNEFFEANAITLSDRQMVELLMEEARHNKFTVKIQYSK
ncbi:hypothetical protein AGMMS4957_01880 [Bacteroidia bacterium]|nr:hypothetical protein AGMMS4957_01880 [Bacteroidia bacterium]